MDLEEIKSRIELRQGDITEVEADAIVSAANTDLILGAGVSGAIGRKGGQVIQDECDQIGGVRLGEAVATSAGGLNAKYVIHAANVEIGHFATEKNIGRATRSAFERAEELGLHSVALPAIGTGVAAFPADKCARVMLAAAAHQLARAKTIERVLFVLYDDETMAEFRAAYEHLEFPPPKAPQQRRKRRPRGGDRRPRNSSENRR